MTERKIVTLEEAMAVTGHTKKTSFRNWKFRMNKREGAPKIETVSMRRGAYYLDSIHEALNWQPDDGRASAKAALARRHGSGKGAKQ